jgi:protein TonB
LGNPLKEFVGWVGEVEKRKEGRLDKTAANNCTTSSSPRNGPSRELATSLVAKPIYTPDPDYPIDERNAKHTGTVLVQAIVNPDGSVGSVSVKQGINPVLDRSALDAVRKWKFAPARLNGVAIAMPTNVKVHFPF